MNNSLKGSLFISLSAIFYASYGIWSRLMQGAFGEFSQAWTRAIILLVILIPFGILTRQFKLILRGDLIWFFVVGLCGGLNQAPYYYGFAHVPIGTATLLFYVSLTVGTYLIGKLFFREKITPSKLIALFLSIIGLLFIYRFALTPQQIIPALASCIAGLMGGLEVVFTKKISGKYSETQILNFIWVIMLVGNLTISCLIKDMLPNLTFSAAWLGQLGYTAAMLIANYVVIIGYKYLEPSIGGLVGLLEVIFAVFFGIILFKEQLSSGILFGGGLILFAMALPELVEIAKKRLFNSVL
jgi:drug/metabolite transporter, DME family